MPSKSPKSSLLHRLLSQRMDGDESRWRPPPLLWIPLIICVGLLFFTDIFQLHYYTFRPNVVQRSLMPIVIDPGLKGFLIKTEGCRIPHMNAFDESIIKCIKNETRSVCNKGKPALVDSNDTSLFLVESSLDAYSINDTDLLNCCYRVFWRVDPVKTQQDNRVQYAKKCVDFVDSVNITEEFVKVTCSYNESHIYTDFFAFVPFKRKNATLPPDRPFLNVLVIGLDAVSRLNLHRQLPKTVKLLKQLNAVEMLGYNKVGDNTFPNLIPVLTGLSEEELVKLCWPTTSNRFDKCPFVWNDYKKRGYLTAYAEDSAWMSVFNYLKRGFHKQPTDYYWSIFNIEAENAIGNMHFLNVNRCVGSREVYKTFLEYISRFVKTMERKKQPYFGFFWQVSLSHDFLNTPKWGDEDFEGLFRSLHQSGALNRTVLIFMSDHGIRWGPIRATYQGRMEERLPFLNIILPEAYRQEYYQTYFNLVKNTRRLTTPFDLHETLVDLLEPFALTADNLYTRSLQNQNATRGYSLFDKIPSNRTCDDAGIAAHWCTCQQSTPIKSHATIVIEGAKFMVKYINQKLEGYAECANLTLDVIFGAQKQTHSKHIAKADDGSEDYTIAFRTQPGGGVFEGTVRKYLKRKEDYLEVTGSISRINLYGKQSLCMTDFHLKLYCYCKGFLEN